MKTTVVPAQITSVEDRIAGNLSFKQLILMITPVFVSTALFILLPPFTKYQLYKVIISVTFALLCFTLALRVKGKLVIEWIIMLSHYNLRPRFYVFNKNSGSSRSITPKPKKQIVDKEVKESKSPLLPKLAFTTGEILNFENALGNPNADLHFIRSKKGGLRVHIKKVK
ncbi:PrgI family protein [Candidatus Saccharibacteria bacterium]|nr:PrgI family protein [Candidatus Saccharibacteria bacterium]MCA9346517.1 PrgI family protein [Candidatus Saccharibacteria bacterium]